VSRSFLKIISVFTLFFFSTALFAVPSSFAEKPCWNDGSLSYGIGGITAATDIRKGDINKRNKTEVTDPIDVSNGNYFYKKQDISIPSTGMSLQITRVYNSLDIYDGPFGIGWNHNYNIFLLSMSDGSETYILRRNADGSKDKFLQKPDGSYITPAGCYDSLVKDGTGYSILDKHGIKYSFDLNGKLKSITDRNLNKISFEYDSQTGVLNKAADNTGRFISFVYNSNHKITSIKDFTGRIIKYVYDTNGDLVGSISSATLDYPDGATISYSYTQHRLTSITDAKGQKYVYLEYGPDDKVLKITYGTGVYSFSYQPNLTTLTDPKGFKTEYILNPDGTVKDIKKYSCYVRPTDPSYFITSYVYNADRERIKIIYPAGNWVKYVYDSKGNCVEIRKKKKGAADFDSPENDIVTQFTYESQFNFIKTITDPNNNTTTYYYDYEETTLGDLNGDGITDGRGGNLVKISYPAVDGRFSEAKFTYNSFGQIVTAQDPNGNITKYEYNADTGYLTKIIRGFGALNITTEINYDPTGNVKSVKDPKGNTAKFDYDTHNNLVKTTACSPFNHITTYRYDANDNLIEVNKETGDINNPRQTVRYTYNILDKLETAVDPLGNTTAFNYDEIGNISMIKDAESNFTSYEYDERNLLWKATDALCNITEYTYDYNGNLKEIKDANNNITAYTYDDFDRLIAANYADGKSESYWYDRTGNLTNKFTRGSDDICYIYDALNRLIRKETLRSTITYTYDSGSRLRSVSDAEGNISYAYDALDRVNAVSYPGNKSISYEYDANGNRTKLTYPDSDYISYEYDNLNRLTDIKNASGQAVSHYSYDALSRRTAKTLLNGTSATYAYDAVNRLTQLSQLSKSIQYTYDKASNRKTMITPGGTHTYGYDKMYQLKEVDYPASAGFTDTTFNYNSVGNRTSTISNGTTSYISNSVNQYIEVNDATIGYDMNGNLTSIATNTYSYDLENRLTSATTPSHTASYGYDPFGRRISKTVDGVTTKFLYDGDQIIAECDGSDNMTAKYINGASIDETIRMDRGANSYYYHHDGLGSVTNLTDATGATVESYAYDVFGKPSSVSSIGNARMFTGRDYDQETGLYYYRARMYSPELGRFLQTDPIGYRSGINLYTYCSNNPLNFVDPMGLCKQGSYISQTTMELLALLGLDSNSLNGLWTDEALAARGILLDTSRLERAGDNLSTFSFGLNIVALGSLLLGPEMLPVAEGISMGSAAVDASATAVYLTDAITNGNRRSGVKAILSGVNTILDVALSSSVAVKSAYYGSRYYSTATGRYVTNVAGTTAAAKPILIGMGVDMAGGAVSERALRR